MEDLIAILALAIECAIFMLVARSVRVPVPFGITVAVFVVLAFIGLGVWDKKDVGGWRKLAVASVILGIGFFGTDVLLAHLHGQTILQFPGGLLGLPLTFVTWCSAMVSLAGLSGTWVRVSAQILGQPRSGASNFFSTSLSFIETRCASRRRSTSIQRLSKGICFYEVSLWPFACSQAIVFNGGVSVTQPLIALCLGVATVLFAQDKSTLSPRENAQRGPGEFENQFLVIQIVPGWTVATSTGQTLTLVKGKYLLSINPIFLHASGVIGGRFGEIASGKKSIDAVMHNVDQPAGGFECSEWPPEALVATKAIALGNLYSDSSKAGNGCTFPSRRGPVWFGSYFSGQGSETDYAITLSYDTNDVNALPKKNEPELTLVFRQVAQMLKTLQLKPPMTISKVDPDSALPGATITIYGSGFHLFNEASSAVQFSDFPNNPMSAPAVAADGKSLTFQVPTSINTVSCDAGQIDVGESCVPIPANHVDINDCLPLPDGSTNWCGVPIPPSTYQISVTVPGWGVSSNPVSFTVIAAKPASVSILLLYPNDLVSVGDTITVRGSGFTPTGNTVQIGSAVVENLSSPDGHMITFQAPATAGVSFVHGIKIYSATVANTNGQSNSISFGYR